MNIHKVIEENWKLNIKGKDIAILVDKPKHYIYSYIKKNNIIRYYEDKDWLYKKHYIEKNNLEEISNLANCSRDTIERQFKKFGYKQDNRIRYSSKNMKKYKIENENMFEKIDTQEKAYWLGFIVADGSVQKMKCNSYRLSILLAYVDKNHLTKFKNFLKTEQPIKDNYTTLNNRKYLNSCLRINSTKICNDLINCNVYPNKSTREIFPKNILPQELIRHFIRGYFDGDGCFSYSKSRNNNIIGSINFVGSKDILDNIFYYISQISSTTATVRENGKIYTLTISKDLDSIMNYLYDDATIYLDRKYEKYNTYLSLKKI